MADEVYLLDDMVLSEFAKPRPYQPVVEWFRGLEQSRYVIPHTFVFEVRYGIALKRQEDAARADKLQLWLDEMIRTGGPALVPMTVESWSLYADMFANPRLKNFIFPDPKSKRPKSGIDLMNTAIAITGGYVIASRDTSDLLQIHNLYPLPGLYNPFSDTWAVTPPSGPLAP